MKTNLQAPISTSSTKREALQSQQQQHQQPALEWSSDSSSDDSYAVEEEETGKATSYSSLYKNSKQSLLDRTEGDEADETLSPQADANALLRTVAAVHLSGRNSRYDADYGEARTSISSPGRRLTLRERIRARARLQRRIQAAREDQHTMNDSRLVEDEEEDVDQQNDVCLFHNDSMKRNRSNKSSYPRTSSTSSSSSRNMVHDAVRVQIVPTTNSTTILQETAGKEKSQTNRISIHVYDLIEKDTLMMLPPFGCVVEIGKCFADMNTALHAVGTGVYHVGVEINGVEYAYGATSVPNQTGVFTCFPRLSPGYQYRTTIDLGERPLIRRSWISVPSSENSQQTVYRELEDFIPGRTVMKEMAREYMGSDYDILRKNCCTFARDACLRLGVPEEEIPTWFCNLAESGALTQDAVRATVDPITSVLSLACEDFKSLKAVVDASDEGIEAIFQTTDQSGVLVVDDHARDLRRNSTWAY